MNSETMSKLQKKTLEAVGWLGSSGYQTIVYCPPAKSARVCEKDLSSEENTSAKAQDRSEATPKH